MPKKENSFKNILLISRILKFQLPLLASTSGDILEVFLVKHSLVCNQLGRFSFSSKTFKPEEKHRKNLSPTGQVPGFGQTVTEVVSSQAAQQGTKSTSHGVKCFQKVYGGF